MSRRPSLIINPPGKNAIRAKRGPTLLRGILGRTLQRYGLDKEVAKYQFVLHWKDIVGEQLAKVTKPECVRNGALVVQVSSNALAQELSFQKKTILTRLQRYLDQSETVSDVRFYVSGVGA